MGKHPIQRHLERCCAGVTNRCGEERRLTTKDVTKNLFHSPLHPSGVLSHVEEHDAEKLEGAVEAILDRLILLVDVLERFE